MKKSALATTVAALGMLAGCQEATTGSVSSSSSSTLAGFTSLHSGIATALAADSTPLDSAVIDSSGSFRIPLPSDAVPVLVRCDSSGRRLWGLVPSGGRDSIVVDSATHLAVDSLRKNRIPLTAFDSATWDALRQAFEKVLAKRHLADSASRDSLRIGDSLRVDTGVDSLQRHRRHHRPSYDSVVNRDSLQRPWGDSARLDSSARNRWKTDSAKSDSLARIHKIDSTRTDSISSPRPDSSWIDSLRRPPLADSGRTDSTASAGAFGSGHAALPYGKAPDQDAASTSRAQEALESSRP